MAHEIGMYGHKLHKHGVSFFGRTDLTESCRFRDRHAAVGNKKASQRDLLCSCVSLPDNCDAKSLSGRAPLVERQINVRSMA